MSLVTTARKVGKGKCFTRAEDELIVSLANEGTAIKEISATLKEKGFDRSSASVQSRIATKLSKVNSFSEIKYADEAVTA